MSQEISEPKTHVLVTYTGVRYYITEQQAAKVYQADPDAKWVIEGNMVKQKNIADILTLDKFYESNPEARGAYQRYSFGRDEGMSWEEIKKLPAAGFGGILDAAKSLQSLRRFEKGLLKAMGEMGQPVHSAELLEKVRRRIAIREAGA